MIFMIEAMQLIDLTLSSITFELINLNYPIGFWYSIGTEPYQTPSSQ